MPTTVEYIDLEIHILKRIDRGYPVELTANRDQRFNGGFLPHDIARWRPTHNPEEDGERLFQMLFSDAQTLAAWSQIRGQSEAQHAYRRVRLRIDSESPEVHAIPWEWMRDPSPGLAKQTLAADANTPFSRYLVGAWHPGEPVSDRPLRIVVAVANPDDLSEHGLAPIPFRERNSLQGALTGVDKGLLTIEMVAEPVTLTALAGALDGGVHILHLIAHGQFKDDQVTLYLADDNNRVRAVTEAEFIQVVAHARPQLVFLSSCETGKRSPADAWRGLAPHLVAAGIPAVLAMQDKISIDTAQKFTRLFYEHLVDTGYVDKASNAARAALLDSGDTGSGIPVLFSRLPDNRLFAPPAAPPPRPATPDLALRQSLMNGVQSRWLKPAQERPPESSGARHYALRQRHSAVEGSFADLGIPKQPDRTFAANQPMIDVFQAAGGSSLLVLGNDSAEATSLLHLAQEVLARAVVDSTQSLPALFDLSRWSYGSQTLHDWLMTELETGYGIPANVALEWLRSNQLFIFLVGLDRVAGRQRAACVQAINRFVGEYGLTPLAVSCDVTVYGTLDTRLKLRNAIQAEWVRQDVDAHVTLHANQVDLEIQIEKQSNHSVTVTLIIDSQRQIAGGQRTLDSLPIPTNPPTPEDGFAAYRWLFGDENFCQEWENFAPRSHWRNVRMNIDPELSTLHDLPWEAMRSSPNDPPLAMVSNTSFIRYVRAQELPLRQSVQGPIRMLLAVASPVNVANYARVQVDAEKESKLINQALFGSKRIILTEIGVELPLTLASLMQQIRKGVTVLHLVAHGVTSSNGVKSAVLLADEDGAVKRVPIEKLVEAMALSGTTPRVVVLAEPQPAQKGASRALQALARALIKAGVAATVVPAAGGDQAGSFDAGYRFFRAFYQHLDNYQSIDRAIHAANVAYADGDLSAGQPALLYSRTGDLRLFAEPSRPAADGRDRRNELILLEKVRSYWVEGVLDASLRDLAMIELRMTAEYNSPEHPRNLTVALAKPQRESILTNLSILELFDRMGGSMLILGAPGSGKTFTLLELARDLLSRAEADARHPLPVVLNVSSWSGHSLSEWATNELRVKYQIPRKIGRRWLDEDQRLLLLLDGLDEVEVQLRPSCIRAINEYRKDHVLSQMVICSRLHEYEESHQAHGAKLHVNGAVTLQALEQSHVEAYLDAAGPALHAVRAALEHDTDLQEMAQTPLMLHVMTLAYEGKESLPTFDTLEARRQHLLSEYISSMFARIARKRSELFGQAETRSSLAWLAQQMTRHRQSEYLIEQMQWTWLSGRLAAWAYMLGSRLALWLLVGLVFGLLEGIRAQVWFNLFAYPQMLERLSVNYVMGDDRALRGFAWILERQDDVILKMVRGGLACGLAVGVATGIVDRMLPKGFDFRVEGLAARVFVFLRRMFLMSLIAGVVLVAALVGIEVWFGSGSVLLPTGGIGDPESFPHVWLFLLAVWAVRQSRQDGDDVRPVEALVWSWRKALCFGALGLAMGSALGLIQALTEWEWYQDLMLKIQINSLLQGFQAGVSLPTYSFPQEHSQALRLIVFLQSTAPPAITGGVLGALAGGLTSTMLKGKTKPNQGIRLSWRNTMLAMFVVGPVLAVVGGLAAAILSIVVERVASSAQVPLSNRGAAHMAFRVAIGYLSITPLTALLAALWYGAPDIVNHYALRCLLSLRGVTPLNLIPFLDHATERIFLRRVGGGFIFAHRLLLDHFAQGQAIPVSRR